MIKFVSETDYFNGCNSIRRVENFSTRKGARGALAQVLRQVRHDLSVVVLRDGPECYMITNTMGARVFERVVRVQS